MRRSLVALTAATTIAVAAVATPTTADARWRGGGWWGPALGGFALGAIVGSAFARPLIIDGTAAGGLAADDAGPRLANASTISGKRPAR